MAQSGPDESFLELLLAIATRILYSTELHLFKKKKFPGFDRQKDLSSTGEGCCGDLLERVDGAGTSLHH